MSARVRHTTVYAGIGILVTPVVWWIGLVDVTQAAFLLVLAPIAYWCGFGDGERYGEKRW